MFAVHCVMQLLLFHLLVFSTSLFQMCYFTSESQEHSEQLQFSVSCSKSLHECIRLSKEKKNTDKRWSLRIIFGSFKFRHCRYGLLQFFFIFLRLFHVLTVPHLCEVEHFLEDFRGESTCRLCILFYANWCFFFPHLFMVWMFIVGCWNCTSLSVFFEFHAFILHFLCRVLFISYVFSVSSQASLFEVWQSACKRYSIFLPFCFIAFTDAADNFCAH